MITPLTYYILFPCSIIINYFKCLVIFIYISYTIQYNTIQYNIIVDFRMNKEVYEDSSRR